jgi:hypothetical protein
MSKIAEKSYVHGGATKPLTNLAFGDADRKALYISAKTSIHKLRTKVPGQF